MFRCKKCLMPNTRPNIKFSEEGICYPCLIHEKRKLVNWDDRLDILEDLCRKYRGKGNYDMIIPMSSGKDSHFQVGFFKMMGMNPLGIMIDNFSWSKTGRDNFNNISEMFGIDIFTFTPNRKEMKEYIKRDFTNELWPNKMWDKVLYSKPLQLAQQLGIKLVAWGENVGEFIGGKNPDFTSLYPEVEVIYLSDYVQWSRFDNVEYAKKNGFKTIEDEWSRWGLEEFPYEQVDTVGYLVNIYCKFIKFGFGLVTEICSDMIRHGLITREEGLEMIKENDWKLDKKMLYDFLEFINMKEMDFWDVIVRHRNLDLVIFRGNDWMLKEEYLK